MILKNAILFIAIFIIISIPANAQRNTILIIADDVGTDYFGFYNKLSDTVNLPNIRRLVSKGVQFNNFTANPICSSTRATILSGRYGFRTGVGYVVGSTQGSGQIDTAELSIPKLLKIHNPTIAKANIGKWHLNNAMPAFNLLSPQALGYDWYEGPFTGAINDYYNWTKYTNGISSNVTNYATSENVNNAISWIKSTSTTNPFFMWLAFNAPHEPLHLPPNNLHTYSNLPGTTAHINANPRLYFKAMIQAMDTEIGRLMDSLSAINKLDSTDFIFIGDNGNSIKTAQITPATKSKGTIYEYGVHTPLIIAGPSIVNPDRASEALVNSVDLFATIVENFGYVNWATQIPNNKPVDSRSLLPIMKNTSDSIRPWAFTEMFKLNMPDSNDGKAIRNKNYKLIRFDNGKEAFYDLKNDQQENSNLLLNNLSAEALSNYHYLCQELTNLVGAGNLCTLLDISDINSINNTLIISPNPITNYIKIHNTPKDIYCELIDIIGNIIYAGPAIQEFDCSFLQSGNYYLKTQNSVVKLVKL